MFISITITWTVQYRLLYFLLNCYFRPHDWPFFMEIRQWPNWTAISKGFSCRDVIMDTPSSPVCRHSLYNEGIPNHSEDADTAHAESIIGKITHAFWIFIFSWITPHGIQFSRVKRRTDNRGRTGSHVVFDSTNILGTHSINACVVCSRTVHVLMDTNTDNNHWYSVLNCVSINYNISATTCQSC